jgi:molybdate-binding protein/DNA-binding XRE family transcriptional regulator
MSSKRQPPNRVKSFRLQRGWSQEEVARQAGISRAAVSAIEIARLVPSVGVGLALAAVFGCRVEDLFGEVAPGVRDSRWAWLPGQYPGRFWCARVRGRNLFFPVEPTVAGIVPHDGVIHSGTPQFSGDVAPGNTLVMASCDPAASLLVHEVARVAGFRLLVLRRSSREALALLRQELVDVAGIHLASATSSEGNISEARAALGPGFSLVRAAQWQEGLALRPGGAVSSLRALLRTRLRWVGRQAGSGARQCQDDVLQDQPQPRRFASDHYGVAEAIRCGWADVGVCLRLVCEEAGLQFIKLRDEAYDLCFPTELEGDPRLRALFQVLRSAKYRQWLTELPGYECPATSETIHLT